MKINKIVLTLLIILSFSYNIMAQVVIGDGGKPSKAGVLELRTQDPDANNITSVKGGVILPRVFLTDASTLDPFLTGTESDYASQKTLNEGDLVYNLTNNTTFCPGVYVWKASVWNKLGESCEDLPNSYFVLPGETFSFPVKKPYLVWNKRSDLTPFKQEDKISVNLLWQDKPNLINSIGLENGDLGSASRIQVVANNDTGNALVAIHIGPNGDSTDPIYWSWHIWVTDYNPNNTGTTYTYNNGEKNYVFMDRNLGALINEPYTPLSTASDPSANNKVGDVLGLLYQWGRKDPFTSSYKGQNTDPQFIYDINGVELTELTTDASGNVINGTGIKHIEAPVSSSNLSISITNPSTIYYGSNSTYTISNFNWYTGDASQGDDNLWDTAEGKKSYFDPCPTGWRVPTYSATQSPWEPYYASGDLGFDPVVPSYYKNIKVQYPSGNLSVGADFNATSSSDLGLGYYPYGDPRTPVDRNAGGWVGSGGSYPGGTLGIGSGQSNDDNFAYYWTATPTGGNGASKLMYMESRTDAFGIGSSTDGQISYATEGTYSKALGGFVRCVKE